MKVTVEHLPQRQVVMTIEAEPAEYEASKKLAYRHIADRAKVPGFRPGKAPMSVVERYTGKAAFLQETIEHLVPDATDKAMKEHGIEAFREPDIELVTTEPVAWKATVDLVPLVDLGGYASVRMPEVPVEATAEEISESLEQLRKTEAPWEPVSRPVAFDDLVTLDMRAEDDGKVIGEDKGAQYQVIAGSTGPAPGFPEELVGLSAGESKEFDLQFPATDMRSEVSGKTIHFVVTAHDVKAKSLPALDDEFAKSVDEGFDTLDALRERVTQQIVESKKREERTALEERALQAVIDGASLDYSPGMVSHEAMHILDEQKRELERNQLSMTDYLKTLNKTEEELLEEVKPLAEQRLKRSLVLLELRKQEHIEVTDEEFNADMDRMAAGMSDPTMLMQIFRSEDARASLRSNLLNRKSLNRLVEIVTGAGTEAAPESKEGVPSGDK